MTCTLRLVTYAANKLQMYSRTSNNGHCRGIQILSVIGGVTLVGVRQVTYGGDSGNRIFVLYWRCPLIRVSVIRDSTVFTGVMQSGREVLSFLATGADTEKLQKSK
jgi:hypothetical protein